MSTNAFDEANPAFECPSCESSSVSVQAVIWFRTDHLDMDSAYSNGYEYDDDSPAVCRECGYRGTLLNFDPEFPGHELEPDDIPEDFEVQPIRTEEQRRAATGLATCGTCELSWDDDIVTGMTPAPSARCPFEYFHAEVPQR